MKNLSTKNCWKLLGGGSLLICAGSLAACLISNNNQNQIKTTVNGELTTNNKISNQQSTVAETSYIINNLSEVQSFFSCDSITSGTIYLTLYDGDNPTASFTCYSGG